MPSDIIDIQVETTRPDRRELLARLCDELARVLASGQGWEGDGFVVPWHASTGEFAALPGLVTTTIIDAWNEEGGQLAGIEFSGYLETDHGPRAWGSLMTQEGEPRAQRPELLTCTVERAGDGYHLDARLRTGAGTDD